jgi:lytic murein transglycosylase
MHRRVLIALLLAGCASPPPPQPQAPPPASRPAPSAPAPSAPPAATPPAAPVSAASQNFDVWLPQFRARALQAGIDPALFDREMAGLAPDDRVSALDSRQPEFSKPVGDYIKGVVTADRIAIGQRRHADLAFWPAMEQRYGVPRDILMGIWALESGFGAIQGDSDVIRSMSTLAADGRRRAFAEGEVIAALKIIASGEHPRSRLRGSWAGAMGQTQFLSSTFLRLGVDGDGDGRRDIWGSSADALASAANLLSSEGWRRGESWAREVTVPAGFDYSLTEGPRDTPDIWGQKGVKPADGRPWSAADRAAPAQLIAPSGAAGPMFLIFPNHFAIRKYNNSTAYALGVGLLADRFAGGGPLVKPWPQEIGLGVSDRLAAQQALNKLGFDTGQPDGVVGVNTRAALRAWQKSRGLIADGYLSVDMVRRLKAEAGS